MDPQKGKILSNYWQITCFCYTWNLLSVIIAAKIMARKSPVQQDSIQDLLLKTIGLSLILQNTKTEHLYWINSVKSFHNSSYSTVGQSLFQSSQKGFFLPLLTYYVTSLVLTNGCIICFWHTSFQCWNLSCPVDMLLSYLYILPAVLTSNSGTTDLRAVLERIPTFF